MDMLVSSLAPVFAAGFAVQQLMEVLDPIWARVMGDQKRWWIKVIALVVGLLIALTTNVRVLLPLGIAGPGLIDVFVTGFVVSAGTEGVNSVLKWMENTKGRTKMEMEVMERQARAA